MLFLLLPTILVKKNAGQRMEVVAIELTNLHEQVEFFYRILLQHLGQRRWGRSRWSNVLGNDRALKVSFFMIMKMFVECVTL